jgi:protocatechuate 3,4-dioxygenase beta subunit
MSHDDHDDFGGLHRDMAALGVPLTRRDLLRSAARFGLGLSALPLIGCGDTTTAVADSTNPNTNTSCSRIPEETAGPFPGDGSNGANVLNQAGVVRSDVRSSFGALTGTAAGVPLTVALTIVSASSCAALANRAIYIWHCDRAGLYSLYSAGATNQNYLRGVQQTDSAGRVSFTSIFPGCYAGRWPHIHFEIFPSLAAATNVANKVATSQLAIPKDACDATYATAGYEASVRNLAGISLATDGVFSDGATRQIATMSGSVATGYTATLTIAVP